MVLKRLIKPTRMGLVLMVQPLEKASVTLQIPHSFPRPTCLDNLERVVKVVSLLNGTRSSVVNRLGYGRHFG